MNWILTLFLIVVALSAGYYYYAANYHAIPNNSTVQCGTISSHGNYQSPFSNNSTTNAGCFYTAARKGRIANLTLIYMGVDSGVIHNFTISSNGVISDTVTNYVVPSRLPEKSTTYTCNGISVFYNSTTSTDGLLISNCLNESNTFIPYR